MMGVPTKVLQTIKISWNPTMAAPSVFVRTHFVHSGKAQKYAVEACA
jgi:hypothetical protein